MGGQEQESDRTEDTGERSSIVDRSLAFAARIVNLFRHLQRDRVGLVLGNQVLRAGTAIGANVWEAQAAQSKADFIAKMTIAHKEAREVAYWIEVLQRSGTVERHLLEDLESETAQLIRILSSILLSAKRGTRGSSTSSRS